MRIQLEIEIKKEEQKADCCFRSSDNNCCFGCSVLLYGKVSGGALTKKAVQFDSPERRRC